MRPSRRGAGMSSEFDRNYYGRGTKYASYGHGDNFWRPNRRNFAERDYHEHEGVRTISGRYSDFEDDSRGAYDGQYYGEGERRSSRRRHRGQFSAADDENFYERNPRRRSWSEPTEDERDDFTRRSSSRQNYRRPSRGYSEFDYDDDRLEPNYSHHRGRYHDERWLNNYDNQQEDIDDEYGYRARRYDNRY